MPSLVNSEKGSIDQVISGKGIHGDTLDRGNLIHVIKGIVFISAIFN